jgi:hypothetical protein
MDITLHRWEVMVEYKVHHARDYILGIRVYQPSLFVGEHRYCVILLRQVLVKKSFVEDLGARSYSWLDGSHPGETTRIWTKKPGCG